MIFGVRRLIANHLHLAIFDPPLTHQFPHIRTPTRVAQHLLLLVTRQRFGAAKPIRNAFHMILKDERFKSTIYVTSRRKEPRLGRVAAHTSAFGDPHQFRKTGLTPTSALVNLPTRRGWPLFHPGAGA
jgi:hypothetical protein